MKLQVLLLVATLAAACESSPAPQRAASTAHDERRASIDERAPSLAHAARETRDASVPSDEARRLADEAGQHLDSGDLPRALELMHAAFEAGDREPMDAVAIAYLEGAAGRTDASATWLERAVELGFDDAGQLTTDARFTPLLANPRIASIVERLRSDSERRNRELGVGSGLERSTPEAEGIDAVALRGLEDEARSTHSSALVVLRDGKVVVEEYFGGASKRIEAMSATKSIVSLAVGLAVDEGKLASVEAPVHELFPEWRQGKKEHVTIRQLMNHTSGLQANSTTEEIYRAPDYVALALAAELADEPGAQFFYNNKAVNLLPAIVERATGVRMDEYLREKLFQPLGIRDVTWSLDSAGHPHGMAGLQIHPIDLAKIGQMLLDGGMWQGRRIVSEEWIEASAARAGQSLRPDCALLWWLVLEDRRMTLPASASSELEKRGLDASDSAKIADLFGVAMTTEALHNEITARLGPRRSVRFWTLLREARIQPEITFSSVAGFAAMGYRGQYLVVLPKKRIVAVRMSDEMRAPENEVEMASFSDRVRALVP